jgi:hypothetical protein
MVNSSARSVDEAYRAAARWQRQDFIKPNGCRMMNDF